MLIGSLLFPWNLVLNEDLVMYFLLLGALGVADLLATIFNFLVSPSVFALFGGGGAAKLLWPSMLSTSAKLVSPSPLSGCVGSGISSAAV